MNTGTDALPHSILKKKKYNNSHSSLGCMNNMVNTNAVFMLKFVGIPVHCYRNLHSINLKKVKSSVAEQFFLAFGSRHFFSAPALGQKFRLRLQKKGFILNI